jgi:hypothetical protein
MAPEVLTQIIETGGLIVAPLLTVLLTYFLLRNLLRIRQRFDHEADLLREALFYRVVIEKYAAFSKKHSPDRSEHRMEFWEQAKRELDMPTPERTQPARIKKRLLDLDESSDQISFIIDRLK